MTVQEPYRPANGSEGSDFMDKFCHRCKRDEKFRETQAAEDGCPIALGALVYQVEEDGYPEEWVVDQGDVYGKTARCTAFEEVS